MGRKLHILKVSLNTALAVVLCIFIWAVPEKAYSSDKTVVHMYFADKENKFLMAEDRTFSLSYEPVELGEIIVKGLIEGSHEGLMRTVPAETGLRAFYITQDGTAYVDLTREVKGEHPGGVKSELLTIYSIVNSLILNISEINVVKIIIGGGESPTLAGHVDLRLPFTANMLLIR